MARGKILCLHGSGTSAEVRHMFNFPKATANAANQILRHQLYPLGQKLKEDVGVEFVFAQAEVVTPPAIGVAEVYEGPYLSFFSWSDPPTSEDLDSVAAAYELIYDMIEDEGPFEGILGFSQGATLACAFLLHHSQEHSYDLPFVHFRYAIFIAGLPPRTSNSEPLLPSPDRVVLLPTVHISGTKDDAFPDSLRLSEMCKEDMKTMVIHDQGHIIPRESQLLREVVKAVRDARQIATAA
ncbi:serine hydrolase FSH [Phaeosphaeria sp. MPI-PUGE-AT-0046c]|nr:serine hydrolase FSH [Phaeosphaeria sp. MPI-PUGE-AT-0046c]